ncbi:MAG: glycosyltransferase, partial [Nitrospirae bacterium]|nr:glycosyltransferase [Nitrospirota bacterium]
DIVHHVAIKPILYGSIAALITDIKSVINALSGMGYVFISKDYKAKLLRPFIKRGLNFILSRANNRVIIQNTDDRHFLINSLAVPKENIIMIRGSGVNTSQFAPMPEPKGTPIVILVARMLWDKGIREFVQAAKMIKEKGVDAKFILVGSPDPENPASICEQQLLDWQNSGFIEWLGHQNDIPAVWAQAHIAVLPSYGEGLPKSLIEAASHNLEANVQRHQ